MQLDIFNIVTKIYFKLNKILIIKNNTNINIKFLKKNKKYARPLKGGSKSSKKLIVGNGNVSVATR